MSHLLSGVIVSLPVQVLMSHFLSVLRVVIGLVSLLHALISTAVLVSLFLSVLQELMGLFVLLLILNLNKSTDRSFSYAFHKYSLDSSHLYHSCSYIFFIYTRTYHESLLISTTSTHKALHFTTCPCKYYCTHKLFLCKCSWGSSVYFTNLSVLQVLISLFVSGLQVLMTIFSFLHILICSASNHMSILLVKQVLHIYS